MIVGVGVDIVAVDRLRRMYQRHGTGALQKLLSVAEYGEFDVAPCKEGFLAKRFAAKEALAKALGTGLRHPVVLTSIGVRHDALGQPEFQYTNELEDLMRQRGVRAHLSISDERDYAVAFVVLEKA